jgi:uncharacterized protein (TIGR03437 family)
MRLVILLGILVLTAYSADFTTYIGGTSPTQSIAVSAIAIDSAGNTYVTGSSAFVTKLDPSGNIVFTTSIGSLGSYGNAIAVDPTGNIWVGGQTTSSNFPLVNALQSSGFLTGFLVKVAPDGTVAYSSYFGGMLGNSGVNGIATDPNGNVYVTGFTDASDFPTTAGLPASPVTGSYPPVYGLFAAKLNSTGQKILYSTVIAGMNCAFCGTPNVPRTVGVGIAVDGSGDAVVAGDTNSTDLSVNSGSTAATGAFVFMINATGNELVYFTYLGSDVSVGSFSYPDTAAASPIAADASGNAYVAEYITNPDFPALGPNAGGNPQTLAIELSPDGAMVWSLLSGSQAGSWPNAISLDSSGNVWLTGTDGSMSAPGEPFVEQLTASTSILGQLAARDSASPFSAQFPPGEAGQAIAIDPSGVVHFAGSIGLISTVTPTQPLAPRALSIVNAASNQLSGTVAPGEIISIYGLGLGPANGMTAAPENGLFPTSLGGVQVLVNGAAMPLLYASTSQINAEIPSGIASGGLVNGPAQVQVVYNSTPLPIFRLALIASDFAPFQNQGSMAVINQDGTLNKIANPAKPGSVVSIWATGFGLSSLPVDGAVATAANSYCSSCQVTLFDGNTSTTETVEYAGTSPGQIDGLMQINFAIPTQLNYEASGVWVYFTSPGYTQPMQLGWVNVSQ